MTGIDRPRLRCADEAAARGDQLAGTTPATTGWLLVEHDRPWGPDAVRSALGDDLAAALHRAAHAGGRRLVMIRRPGRRAASPTRWLTVDSVAMTVRGAVVADDEQLLTAPFATGAGEPVTGPLYLVCAHGRHDPCCARLGRPVAQALAGLAPATTWECSHLGGDRFAANVLVLPSADLYGRVSPVDAPRVVSAGLAGEVVADLWRGRAVITATEQAAVAALLRQGTSARDIDWEGVTCSPLEAGACRVTIPAGGSTWTGLVEVGLGRPAVLTCHASGESQARTFRITGSTPG
ncbi:MAG TPA: sucrase ferredoxin [Candidatus Nanopelagicales bacterium]|nr:sucrase ferredoxin [Candidatus Nanopelagicales bacterium]